MKNLGLILGILLAAGCGSDPTNFTGNYELAIVNGENNCELDNWTVGATTTDVDVVVVQVDGESNAQVTVQGLAGLAVTLVVGTNVFQGEVDGETLSGEIIGDVAFNDGGCVYTVTARLSATLQGDTITGTLRFTTPTNGHADCGMRSASCQSVQNFNGTRPPAPPKR